MLLKAVWRFIFTFVLQIVAVDPEGSVLVGSGQKSKPFEVEGIGSEFLPTVLDASVSGARAHLKHAVSGLFCAQAFTLTQGI